MIDFRDDELEIVGWNGKPLVECGRALPVARRGSDGMHCVLQLPRADAPLGWHTADEAEEYANMLVHGLGLVRARELDTQLVGLAAWDGQLSFAGGSSCQRSPCCAAAPSFPKTKSHGGFPPRASPALQSGEPVKERLQIAAQLTNAFVVNAAVASTALYMLGSRGSLRFSWTGCRKPRPGGAEGKRWDGRRFSTSRYAAR